MIEHSHNIPPRSAVNPRAGASAANGASTANGAPQRGAVAVSTVSLATKRAPLQLSVRPVLASLDTPPAAGRAWVPDRRARTFHQSVRPLYDESTPCGRPVRDRFVISISSDVYMSLTGTRRAGLPCLYGPARAGGQAPMTAVAGGRRKYSFRPNNPPERLFAINHICCNSVAKFLGDPPEAVHSLECG